MCRDGRFEINDVEICGVEEREGGSPGTGGGVVAEVGVVFDEGGDDAGFAGVVDVLGEELVDEAAEHDVADEIKMEDAGRGHGGSLIAFSAIRNRRGLGHWA